MLSAGTRRLIAKLDDGNQENTGAGIVDTTLPHFSSRLIATSPRPACQSAFFQDWIL